MPTGDTTTQVIATISPESPLNALQDDMERQRVLLERAAIARNAVRVALAGSEGVLHTDLSDAISLLEEFALFPVMRLFSDAVDAYYTELRKNRA